MGMAMKATYSVPKIRKTTYMWRVTWADTFNYIYYKEFLNHRAAIEFATGNKDWWRYQ